MIRDVRARDKLTDRQTLGTRDVDGRAALRRVAGQIDRVGYRVAADGIERIAHLVKILRSRCQGVIGRDGHVGLAPRHGPGLPVRGIDDDDVLILEVRRKVAHAARCKIVQAVGPAAEKEPQAVRDTALVGAVVADTPPASPAATASRPRSPV